MQAVFVQDGEALDYTPAGALNAGDVVNIGSIPMPTKLPVAAAALGVVVPEGVFDVVKDTSTFADGDSVYWNATGNPVGGVASSGCATSSSSGNLMGFAVPGTTGLAYPGNASGDATVRVKLTAARRTTTLGGAVVADSLTGDTSSLGITGFAAAQGGTVAIAGGTSSTGGNAGGPITITGGVPGVTGVGGAVTIAAGAGGATSGAGGVVSIAGGAGTALNSAGGAVTIVGGVGSATNAAGGLVSNIGGAGAGSSAGGLSKIVGGAGGATGAGGAVQMTGGAGGATSGTGGAATIAAGAGTGTTAVGGAATVTGGASAGASGTAGVASIDAGAATGGTKACVNIGDVNAGGTYLNRGPLAALQVGLTLTALGTVQSSTPTSAQLLGGILTQTGATGAGTVTLPTGTALSTACARTPVAGDTFDCYFYNLGGSQTLTITGATGKMAQMKFYLVSANAWNVYCIVSA